MGDTANWEFAAAVAAVTIGLGGLLLFTLTTIISSWRVLAKAGNAADEAMKASTAMQDLARYLSWRETRPPAAAPSVDLSDAAGELADLRHQADALIEQQSRLQEAVRNLVEAGVLGSDQSGRQLQDLEEAVRRLEENLSQIAAAVANLAQHEA